MKPRNCCAILLTALLLTVPLRVLAAPPPQIPSPQASSAPTLTASTPAPEIAAPSAILVERETGTILYEKNAHDRLRPASVTKIMTMLLVVEAVEAGEIGWDDAVTASPEAAAKGGSQIYLAPGETMPVREMVKAVAVSSANDCAAALAELVAGSEAGFVARMNARAAELGMTDTHFVNCTGLDDGADAPEHLTTARDIALMSRELLSHDMIREFTTIWTDTVRDGSFGLANTNKLIRFYEGATGLKTGFTASAGYCLSASACRGGTEYIAVVLHCATSQERFNSARKLLDYAFANFTSVEILPETEIPAVKVELGTKKDVIPEANAEPVIVEKRLASAVTRQVELPESVAAPVEAGQRLGTLRLTVDGKTLAEVPLVAAAPVARLTVRDCILRILNVAAFGKMSKN